MKILKVNFNVGGYAGDIHEILTVSKKLQDLGHEVALATSDANAFYFDEGKAKKYEKIRERLLNASEDEPIIIDDIPVYVTHCTNHSLGMYCPNAKNFAKKIIPKFDVVHIYNWYYHLGIEFSKVAVQQKVPYVYSAAGGLLEGAHNIKNSRKKLVDVLYTKKMISNLSGAVSLGISEDIDYYNRGVDKSKIFRIDNVFILEDYKIKENTDVFKKIDYNKTQPYIVFVSRVDEKKGVDLLMKAFAKLPQKHKKINLIIAGTGTPQYEQEMKELAQSLEISDRTKFTGFISNDEKYQLLEESKIYCLTSRSDIHPHAIGEALIMGAPVLITEPCDYPEVEEFDAGKIVDVNIDKISEALNIMLDDENKLKTNSENAKKIMQERFQLKDHIKKYIDMYSQVINNYKK